METGGSFAGNVNLSVSGLPVGVTAVWTANPIAAVSGASTNNVMLTLATTRGATSGTFSIVVTAAGDGLTSSATVPVEVEARQTGCLRFGLVLTQCGAGPGTPVRWPRQPR